MANGENKKSPKLEETMEGNILYNLDPIIMKYHYEIDYIHSYAQDSPFFAGLVKGKIMGTRCDKCNYGYATPKTHCMQCGSPTKWVEVPLEGKVHTWTTCYFGGEAFLKETPFNLVLVEFEGFDSLFLSRLIGAEQKDIKVGMKVQARFRRKSKFDPTDVYFVPA
ncbi:MAG: Zn-ribbon domain-containing OB-fold protein [Firmicutes bacterium]|nr:Zn-ribbon domain-containing OB-fold protein [Bacillota bacterium]